MIDELRWLTWLVFLFHCHLWSISTASIEIGVILLKAWVKRGCRPIDVFGLFRGAAVAAVGGYSWLLLMLGVLILHLVILVLVRRLVVGRIGHWVLARGCHWYGVNSDLFLLLSRVWLEITHSLAKRLLIVVRYYPFVLMLVESAVTVGQLPYKAVRLVHECHRGVIRAIWLNSRAWGMLKSCSFIWISIVIAEITGIGRQLRLSIQQVTTLNLVTHV